MVAYLRPRHASLPFQVLRFKSDARKGKNLIALAQHRMPVNHHMRMQPAIPPQRHILPNDTKRPNDAALANLRLGMNDG
jgi:hypothetical protein